MDKVSEALFNGKKEEKEIFGQRLKSAKKYLEETEERYKEILDEIFWLKEYGWKKFIELQKQRNDLKANLLKIDLMDVRE